MRCVLLLPSPTLNLNSLRRNKDDYSQNNWSNFDDEDINNNNNNLLSDDEMDLNFNDGFHVKISPNHDNENNNNYHHHHQRRKKLKDRKSGNKSQFKNYHDNEFWILSGTSTGSMLLHKLNNNDSNDSDDDVNQIHNNDYNNYL